MESFKEFGEYVMSKGHYGLIPSDRVHIIINYPKIKWDDWAEYMATLTWFSAVAVNSGGNHKSHLIFAETIDEALQKANDYNYAIISYIGSYYETSHEENIFKYFDEFCESGRTCRGHLLFHPNKQYGRLHPQTIFLNVKNWRELGRPTFGNYTGPVIDYERSDSNVHDDYTPHWVKASSQFKHVTYAEQAQFISSVLLSGETILNFDKQRSVKFFCYPERRYSQQLENLKNRETNIVYTKNTEKLDQIKTNKKFDVIYSPASGYTAEYLYKHYGHENTKLVIYDYNLDSLNWKKMVYYMSDDLNKLNKYFKDKGCIIDDCSYKPDLVKYNDSIFNEQDFINTTKQVKPEFIQFDILEGPFDIDKSKSNLIYLSNIFCYNFAIHRMSLTELENKFNEYLNLENTSIYGRNVFKVNVYNEKA